MDIIPRNWNQVTVEMFQELSKTFKEEPQTVSGAMDLLIKRAVILTDLEVSEIEELPIEELYKVNDLLKKPMPEKIPKYIKHKGHLYAIRLNPKEESARVHMAVMNNCKEDGIKSMHRIMFSVCRPIKSLWSQKELKLSPTEIEQRIEDFKQLPISLVNPVVVFFWALTNRLMTDILEYSDEKMKEMQKMVAGQTDILENTVG